MGVIVGFFGWICVGIVFVFFEFWFRVRKECFFLIDRICVFGEVILSVLFLIEMKVFSGEWSVVL